MPIPLSSDGHRPAGHPPVQHGRIGVLLLNLGTPDATDYWSMRRYLKEFLSDRRVIEVPRWKWWPILNLHHPDRPPRPQGQGLRQDLEQRAQRGPAQDHHARAGREAGRAARRRAHRRRLGHALRQPDHRRAPRRAAGAGLRPHPAGAALSAVCRRHHRDRLRPGLPRADADALAAGRPRGAALLRGPRLHRGDRRLRSAATWPRSTSSPRPSSPPSTACRRRTWKPATPIIASARRPRGWCARGSAGRASAGTRPSSRSSAAIPGCSPTPSTRWSGWPSPASSACCRRRPRLLRRLPGDAGGARHGEPRTRSCRNGGEQLRLRPLPQRQRRRHARHRAASSAAS